MLAKLLALVLIVFLLLIAGSELNATISHPRNTTVHTPHTERPPPAQIFEPPLDHRPVARATSLQVASTAFNDDDIDLDQIADIEAQLTDIPTKRSLTNTRSNPEKKIKIDLTTNASRTKIDLPNSVSTAKIDLTNNESRTKIDLTNIVNTVDDYPDDNDVFINEDEDYLREIENEFDARNIQPCSSNNKSPISVSAEPYVYIKQINDLPESKRAGRVFNVKGQIMKLLSKLSVGKDGWSLKCTIVDGTGSIDVDFTSEVLSKLVGFTPQEMNQLKKQMAIKPELKDKAVCVSYCVIFIKCWAYSVDTLE